ncbi:MAG: hypothetical protein PHT07_11090 [Paludibacter sp.]|nr:hypothetical protein [Paludibacter sp.]
MLPLKQAIRLPFDFYYRIRFECLGGKVQLNTKTIYRGMIKIGGRGSDIFNRTDTVIDLKGMLLINGKLEIGHGCMLLIEKEALVVFGDNVRIGAMSKIYCKQKIYFGNEIDFSWECQIFDTNFHYVRDLLTKMIDIKDNFVRIGSYNWFGNRVTVMKGTITPDHLIVASNSLCNKDYTIYSEYSVLGGIPVKQIGSNKERVFENMEDVTKIDLFFNQNKPIL